MACTQSVQAIFSFYILSQWRQQDSNLYEKPVILREISPRVIFRVIPYQNALGFSGFALLLPYQ